MIYYYSRILIVKIPPRMSGSRKVGLPARPIQKGIVKWFTITPGFLLPKTPPPGEWFTKSPIVLVRPSQKGIVKNGVIILQDY